jgi:hypothetical protein
MDNYSDETDSNQVNGPKAGTRFELRNFLGDNTLENAAAMGLRFAGLLK